MKLPYAKRAIVPMRKLTEYLLSETHGKGKHKARLFAKIGYDKDNVLELKECLLRIGHTEKVKQIKKTLYGKNYLIEGKMTAPIGQLVTIKTVWFIRFGTKHPRLITAYPFMVQ